MPQCHPLLSAPAAQTLADLPGNSAREASTGDRTRGAGERRGDRVLEQDEGQAWKDRKGEERTSQCRRWKWRSRGLEAERMERWGRRE